MKVSFIFHSVGTALASIQTSEVLEILENKGFTPTNIGVDAVATDYSLKQNSSDTINEAIHYASYAGATACSLKKLKSWNCNHCKKLGNVTLGALIQDPRFDTLAIVTTDFTRKEIVLTFRGTSNLKNRIQDFKLFPTDFPGVKLARVHTGFKECSDGLVSKYLFQAKRLLQQPEFNVVVTGHSLGGAIAVLAALRIQSALELRWSRLKVFTYGEPRIGNAYFASYVNSLPLYIIRVVNENDLIPHLPPSLLPRLRPSH
ncbi:hypothetical protein DSO57_1034596 [Entomophthora muscae]|uniref:Uncharacterized protein n=1 Tax=Entomophthora muscae TaxID=34485 RepID=A0ACC2REI9_9FUNG|nr:hypothetical protein DSO57_1034596 [Entomophthora muscae]